MVRRDGMKPLTRIMIGPRRVVRMTPEDQARATAEANALAEFCRRPDVGASVLPDGSVEIAPTPTPPIGGDATARLGFPVRWKSDCALAPEENHHSLITPNARIEGRR